MLVARLMCLGALAVCSLAAKAIVPTLTVTDMLAAHERRQLSSHRHATSDGIRTMS